MNCCYNSLHFRCLREHSILKSWRFSDDLICYRKLLPIFWYLKPFGSYYQKFFDTATSKLNLYLSNTIYQIFLFEQISNLFQANVSFFHPSVRMSKKQKIAFFLRSLEIGVIQWRPQKITNFVSPPSTPSFCKNEQ